MQIPLPKGLRGGSESPKQVETLKNVFSDPSEIPTIMTRPTARKVAEAIGRCRGMGMFKDELYAVSNDRLIKISLINTDLPPTSSNILVTDIGEIAGTQNCQLEAGYVDLAIMVEGGSLYVYDGSTLSEVTDVLYKPSVSITYDGGRFVFVPATGEPFFWSDLANPAAISPTSFADAEEFPDLNKACKVKKKQLYVAGSRSIERLQYNANADTYQTIGGATSAVGYVGGMVDYGETFLFLGQGVNGGFQFYGMASDAEPISNKTVDEILSSYSAVDLENIRGDSFKWEGTEFAIFYLPRHTLVFNGDWSLWHSGVSGDVQETWSVGFFQFCYGYIWTGDVVNRNIGIITDDAEEYGNNIEGEIVTIIRTEPRTNAVIHRLYCALNPGSLITAQSIGMQVSRDGVIFGPMVYRSLGALGDYAREVSWGSPVIKINDHATIRLRWSGKIRLSCDALSFD